MARRIEIELTSTREDGTWTWRAKGAKEPKGTLDGNLLEKDAKVGEVLRVEADFGIDGISILSAAPVKEKKRTEPQRIELISSGRDQPGVTTQLVGRKGRDRGDRGDRGDGRRRESGRTDTRPGSRDRQGQGQGQDRRDGRRSAPRREGAGGGRDSSPRDTSAPRSDRRRDGERTGGPRRPAPKKLAIANTHLQEVLAGLPPEQQAIAEQIVRGGIPAVRTAITLEAEKAKTEGRPAPNSAELLALAERLLPNLKTAEWRDLAVAVDQAGDEVGLRDLRSAVVGSDQARDEESRELASRLREKLESRLNKMRETWIAEIVTQLDEGRVVRALRLSSRPPDATAKMDSELTDRLSKAAGEGLSPDTAPERWVALLEAAAVSPVRRSIEPAGLPADPPASLVSAAQQQAGRLPALAKLMGVSMPPPPGPSRGPRRTPPPPPSRKAEPAAEAQDAAPAPAEQTPTPESPGSETPAHEAPEDKSSDPADEAVPSDSDEDQGQATPAEG